MRMLKRVVLAVVLLALIVAGAAAFAFYNQGYRMYVVRTGSMSPTYDPGSVVVDAPAKGRYQVGDVITFRHSRTNTDLVTHRIVEVNDGYVRTKGDANQAADVWRIAHEQVRGTVIAGIPYLGYVLVFLRQPTGFAAILAGGIGLILLWRLFFPEHEERSRHRPSGPRAAASS